MRHFFDIFKSPDITLSYIDYRIGKYSDLYKQFFNQLESIVSSVKDERYTLYFDDADEEVMKFNDELLTTLERIMLILPMPQDGLNILPSTDSITERLDREHSKTKQIITELKKLSSSRHG